jgi:hypothetical protein
MVMLQEEDNRCVLLGFYLYAVCISRRSSLYTVICFSEIYTWLLWLFFTPKLVWKVCQDKSCKYLNPVELVNWTFYFGNIEVNHWKWCQVAVPQRQQWVNDFPTDLVRGQKFKSQKTEKDLVGTRFFRGKLWLFRLHLFRCKVFSYKKYF